MSVVERDDPEAVTLARFALRERLGEGGMGQVWRARDPELDRDVAVKVLRPEVVTSAVRASEARARLKREAQAMARLAHPNVIAVHEVGDAADQVFVVMELVKGGTLRQWLDAGPRGVDAILDVFVQAGRGLAAAHAAGLVHRDFKPENVLVGDDGRARVTDFGLVGLGEHAAEAAPSGDAPLSLTRTGAVLGTPAYLAPEALRGGAATVASDQFSFCVALYEALWRQPPFPGDTVQALFSSVTRGALVPPPRQPRVPPRVRDAVVRGLAVDPGARWPSMQALLAELTARRSRWVVAGAGGVGLAAVAGIAIVALDGDREPTTTPPPATSRAAAARRSSSTPRTPTTRRRRRSAPARSSPCGATPTRARRSSAYASTAPRARWARCPRRPPTRRRCSPATRCTTCARTTRSSAAAVPGSTRRSSTCRPSDARSTSTSRPMDAGS